MSSASDGAHPGSMPGPAEPPRGPATSWPDRFHDRMHQRPPSRVGAWRESLWYIRNHGPWNNLKPWKPGPAPWARSHRLEPLPDGQVGVTWVGHASHVLQVGGKTLLTDPVWSRTLHGTLRRLAEPGIPWNGLGKVDGVLISHNHYDHLDWPTLRRLPRETPCFVPAGVGRAFHRRGFTDVREMDWWQASMLDDVRLEFVPAHHWSRRGLTDLNRTLWGGWIVQAGKHTTYFAGDTAYGHWFKEIGKRHPGIDLALLPIGAYAPRELNQHIHTDPEEALQAFLDLGARNMLPMHWGTFRLSPEPILEPIQRLRHAWTQAKLPLARLWDVAVGERRVLDHPHVTHDAGPPVGTHHGGPHAHTGPGRARASA